MNERKRKVMTGAEIARAAAEFDEELRGAKVISVSVERALLEESDALARRMDVTRAELIARGLRAVMAAEGHR